MPNKKAAEPEKSAEQKALEERVDAMMDPDRPDLSPPKSTAVKIETGSEDIDVAVRKYMAQTAPDVPGKLLKQIPADKAEAATKPAKPAASLAAAAIPEEETVTETDTEISGESSTLEDSATDKAVDDIVAHEGDIVLAAEDATTKRRNQTAKPAASWKDKLRSMAKNKWTWIGVAALLLLLLAVPTTRYKLLGLIIKQPVTLTIIDSKTKTPVSNALVELGSSAGKTDANGKARLKAPVGKDPLTITKQYYTTVHTTYFVGFKPADAVSLPLVATGRLVPVTVINKITGKPLQGAEIQVLKTTAKTNAKGQANIALPANSSRNKAKVKLAGYNQASVNIEVTDKVSRANGFELTPAGHIYFLSNLNGSLDVVKSNLDGSDRHIVLEGTGKEDKASTSLLASRDWRYLVLKARREGAQPALYLIDTSSDKVTQFDNGNAEFTLLGWYGHAFIYDLTRSGMSNWQAGREVLKSYDAEHLQLNQLDQNQAEGDTSAYTQQGFLNFYIVDGAVVYTTQWYGYAAGYAAPDLSAKNDTIRSISPAGQNKKDHQSFPTTSTGTIQAALYKPQAVYYAVYNNSDNKTTYYEYEDQAVKTAADVDQHNFNQGYPTYLLSPSGNQTFWTELRDGKHTLFTGDSHAKNQKQAASLGDYTPYGWYGDAYTLVSKNSSELYIMPSSAAAGKPPLKITDYYKPAQTYPGYGYGYGGL